MQLFFLLSLQTLPASHSIYHSSSGSVLPFCVMIGGSWLFLRSSNLRQETFPCFGSITHKTSTIAQTTKLPARDANQRKSAG